MTKEQAYDLGDRNGFGDAFESREYDAYNDEVPPEAERYYREGYAAGYTEGKEARES